MKSYSNSFMVGVFFPPFKCKIKKKRFGKTKKKKKTNKQKVGLDI